MTNKFDSASWSRGSEMITAARDSWEAGTFDAVNSSPVAGARGGPVEESVETHTSDLHLKWFNLIGNVSAALNSDASKMEATAQNYSATEDQSVEANERFWSTRDDQ